MMRIITSDNVIAWIMAGRVVALTGSGESGENGGEWGIGESVRECLLGQRKLIAIRYGMGLASETHFSMA
jgi:hypothetical protein